MKNLYIDQEKVSKLLREKRESMGVSIAIAAKELNIRLIYLEALERGNYSIFDSEVYAKGFLRNYAKFLDLDEEKIIKLYRRENFITADHSIANTSRFQQALIDFDINRRKVFVISLIAAFFVVLLVFGVSIYLQSRQPRMTLTEPILVSSSGTGETFKLDTTESSVVLRGEIEEGANITINGDVVNTYGLSTFSIPLEDLKPGASIYELRAENAFGVESSIKIEIVRSQSE